MRLFLVVLFLISTNAVAEIYKKRNPDGSTSYSDVESADSKVIIPPKLMTAPAVKVRKKTKKDTSTDKKVALPYKSFSISSPLNQSVKKDNNGNISLSFSIKPALQISFNHSITLLLNGKPTKTGLTSLTTQVTNLDRGSHTFTALIIGKNKQTLKTSQSVTVHIKRHSKLHPKPAANPGAPTL